VRPGPKIALALGAALTACSATPIDIATLEPDSLTDDQVAHWRFDDTDTTVRDSSGNGRDGLVFGPTWSWTQGKFGGALLFDKMDQVTVVQFPQATVSYSVAAWLRVDTVDFEAPSPTLLTTEFSTGGGGWALNSVVGPPPGNYGFTYSVGPSLADKVDVDCACFDILPWVHLAAVLDASAATLTLYVNGVERDRATHVPSILRGQTTLTMAHGAIPGRMLVGALDDVVIYSRALVPEEIMRLTTNAAPDPQ
jgi:hypothetical protein